MVILSIVFNGGIYQFIVEGRPAGCVKKVKVQPIEYGELTIKHQPACDGLQQGMGYNINQLVNLMDSF